MHKKPNNARTQSLMRDKISDNKIRNKISQTF